MHEYLSESGRLFAYSVNLKNTKIAKMAAVDINIADMTSMHSLMIIYRIFRRTKRTGVKAAPPIFRSIHRQKP
jgi:hypothetical protein